MISTSSEFSQPPFTWEEFDKRLNLCKEVKDLSILCLPSLEGKTITPNLFLRSVKWTLVAYQDRKRENIESFKNHFQRLFPNLDRDEQLELIAIIKKLIYVLKKGEKITELSQSENSSHFEQFSSKELFKILSKQTDLLQIWNHVQSIGLDKVLEVIKEQVLSLSAEGRIEKKLEALSFNKMGKISYLQSLLSSIYAEEQRFRVYQAVDHFGKKARLTERELNKVAKQIFISSTTCIYYKDQSIKDDSDEIGWAFELQYEKLLTQSQDEQSYVLTLQKLNALIEQYPNLKTLKVYKNFSENYLFSFYHTKCSEKEGKLIEQLSNSKLNLDRTDFNLVHKWGSTPLTVLVDALSEQQFHVTKKIEEEGNLHKRYETFLDYYSIRKKIGKCWLEFRNQQKQLFLTGFNQLGSLIQSIPKPERLKYRYNLVLMTKHDSSANFLNPDFFDKSFEFDSIKQDFKQKLESYKVTISSSRPKQPIAPPLDKQENHVPLNIKSEKDLEIMEEKKLEKVKLAPKTIEEILSVRKFPFTFTNRVTRWFEYPIHKDLPFDQFPDYANKSIKYQKFMQVFHGFSQLVDLFYDIGIQDTWNNSKTGNSDQRFIIPAEISIQKDSFRGFIVYCVGQDNNCYHRYFTKVPETIIREKVIRGIMKSDDFLQENSESVFEKEEVPKWKQKAFEGFINHDYPDLQASLAMNQKIKKFIHVNSKEMLYIYPVLGIVEIVDRESSITIKLFPVNSYL